MQSAKCKMKKRTRKPRSDGRGFACLFCTLHFALCTSSFAQTNGGTGAGLDHLDEQRVMETLASNNLETLLNRDFANFNVPENERDQRRSLIDLQELVNYRGTIAGRRALAMKVAKGLQSLMPKASDPELLLQQAIELTESGITPTVTALEYFGENPVTQADLKPVAQTTKRLYEQVSVLAESKLKAIEAGIHTNPDYEKAKPLMDKLRRVKGTAEFSDNLVASYALCIALPKDDPQRKQLADEAIKYLQQFDNSSSGVQPGIEVQVGKFQLLKGENDIAQTTFDALLLPKATDPPPSVGQQNDARYFGIVAMISSHKLNNADKAIPDLENWETASYMPTLKSDADQNEVKASLSMLKFRLYSAQSDLASIDADRQEKNDKAVAVLADLLKSQPSLKDLVFDQLAGRIPQNADYKLMNPLILQAFQQQGFDEVMKPAGAAVDESKLNRAIEAAKELLSRVGQGGVDASTAWRSSFFIAYAYDRLQDGKKAAAAFMDYAENYPDDPGRANDAMDHAGKWIGELRKKDAEDQETRKLYDRFLPLAINPPFNRKQLAYGYAALLQADSKFKESVSYLQQIPESDKHYRDAQYLELIGLLLELNDPTLVGPARVAVVNQIVDLDKAIDGMLASATTPAEKEKYVEWVVKADGIAADLTHTELKDPAKSLEILTGYEERIAGSKDAAKAHMNALNLRVFDYMETNKLQEAVDTVVDLLKENPAQGQGLMFDVLAQVAQEKDKATDPAVKKTLAKEKATLTGIIVQWATQKNDKNLAIYQFNDAEAKREAAELDDDAAAKQKGLQEALAGYRALYNTQKDDASLQGIGLTQYDLGNYPEAMDALGALVVGNKVGQPMITINVGGVPEKADNPQFWETNYKDIRSVVEVYKRNPSDPKAKENLEAARQYVGILYINNGARTGGKTYHDDFENIKAEIAKLQGK